MKKLTVIFLMMSLVSVSCSKQGGNSSSGPETQVTPLAGSPSVPPSNLAETTLSPLALTFETNITQVNFTAQQAEKYNKAIEIVKLVVATEKFRNDVINFTYNGQKAFIDNKGLTNEQIYQSILDAAETLKPIKNNTMDLTVQLYYAATNVVGYTNGGTTSIWVNTKYFNTFMENSVAGNLFHEWLHKLGYTHAYSATTTRPYSVPYAVGYIMGNIGKNFL
jgi:hypothetical protein